MKGDPVSPVLCLESQVCVLVSGVGRLTGNWKPVPTGWTSWEALIKISIGAGFFY